MGVVRDCGKGDMYMYTTNEIPDKKNKNHTWLKIWLLLNGDLKS